MKKLYIS